MISMIASHRHNSGKKRLLRDKVVGYFARIKSFIIYIFITVFAYLDTFRDLRWPITTRGWSVPSICLDLNTTDAGI